MWFDRRLRFNLSTFLYDYEDLQTFTLQLVGGQVILVTENAADATIWGGENRTALEGKIASLETEVAHLHDHATELKRVRDAAAAQRSLVERHLALAAQREQYVQQRSELLAAIEDLLGRQVSPRGNELIGLRRSHPYSRLADTYESRLRMRLYEQLPASERHEPGCRSQ